jgi:RNA polymerase sigma-70 factor (ECF subfamily)
MIRVTTNHESPVVAVVCVEGKLSGILATELMASHCQKLQSQRIKIKLDLRNLTFADRGGKALLQEILNGQNELIECSEYVRAVLDDRKDFDLPTVAPLGEDATLIAQLRKGNDEAFELIVRKFGGRLLATARRYLSSEDDAQDAVQNAFLSAFKSMKHFNGNSALSTWLHRIVINSALMQLRSKRRRPEEPIDEFLPQFDQAGNWMEDRARTLQPQVSLEASETRRMVRRCIDRLPPAHRVMLILRDIDELDTEEAATLLGLTTNTVKVRLHRARQALKSVIGREISRSN